MFEKTQQTNQQGVSIKLQHTQYMPLFDKSIEYMFIYFNKWHSLMGSKKKKAKKKLNEKLNEKGKY